MRPILRLRSELNINHQNQIKKAIKWKSPDRLSRLFQRLKNRPVWLGIDNKALRHRQKIFTTNNHYEWSKVPVVSDMPYL
jgi:hypothetical protein